MGKNRQGLKVTIKFVSDCFQGQVYIASLYVVLNIIAKRWPVIFFGYKLTCFLNIKVAY